LTAASSVEEEELSERAVSPLGGVSWDTGRIEESRQAAVSGCRRGSAKEACCWSQQHSDKVRDLLEADSGCREGDSSQGMSFRAGPSSGPHASRTALVCNPEDDGEEGRKVSARPASASWSERKGPGAAARASRRRLRSPQQESAVNEDTDCLRSDADTGLNMPCSNKGLLCPRASVEEVSSEDTSQLGRGRRAQSRCAQNSGDVVERQEPRQIIGFKARARHSVEGVSEGSVAAPLLPKGTPFEAETSPSARTFPMHMLFG
jgi:hypothetical protein